MNYHDEGTQICTEEQEFLQELKRTTDENAKWQLTGINRIKFVPIDEVADWITTDEEQAIYEDTKNNTKLYMDVPGMGLKAVGTSALATICQRAKISGAALWKLPNEFLSELLNECFSLFYDNTTLFYSLGKIRAAHSDHYVRLDMVEIFEKSTNVLKDFLEGVTWKAGYMDHNCAIAEYEIQDDHMLHEYRSLLKTDDLKATVKVVSSNTGDSGANIYYGLSSRGRNIILSNSLKMNHKGDCSIERFANNMGKTFSQFRAAYANLRNLQKITVIHPNAALYEAMTRQHISKKLVAETVEIRKALSGDRPCDALTLYLDACEVIGIAKKQGMTESVLHDLSEKVSRLACTDWKNYDFASKQELVAA